MDENADGGTVVAVTTENADSVSVDDDRFEVADGNLKLKDGTTLDFESDTSPIEVTITATAEGGDASHTVSVSINDVNEGPSITVADGMTPDGMAATSTIAENAAGVPVGEITLNDPDAGDSHTLEVSDDRFEAAQDAEGGWWLKLKDGMSLDHESESSVTVTVTVTDAGGLTASTDVTVTVDNVDEAPSAPVVRDGALSVDENDEGAVLSSLADSTDPEGDEISYSVDDDRFEITGGLVLKLKDGMSLDHEAGSTVDLTLSASDPAGNTSTSVVTVIVNDVNEAPSITVADGMTPDGMAATSTIAENAAGVPVGEITLSDPDAGDTHTLEVSDDRFETAQDSAGGWWLKLKDGESLDFESESEVTVTVTVTDAAGLSASADVTVMATDVNEAPSVTITGGATVPVLGVESSLTVLENAMGSDLPPLALIEVMDPDAADAAILRGRDGMMATSVDNDAFEIKLDPEGGLWLAVKADASLDHEAANNGMVDVTVTFTDSAGNTGSAVATVIVTDLNEAPMVTVQDGTTPDGMDASSSVEENVAGALVGEITVEDQDDGDTWTPSVADGSDFEVKQDAEGGWWLKLKDDVSLDHEDAATIDVVVTVTDGSGLTDETTVTVTVVNIEEAPSTPALRTASPSVDENDAGASVSVVDSEDPQGDDVTFNVNDDRFEVVDGLLKLKDGESLDHESEDEVMLEVTATDGTYTSAAAMVTVAVNDMNEAPVVTGEVANVTANAGAAIKADPIDLLALFSDPDDGDAIVRYSVSGAPSWLTFSVEYGTDEDGNETVHGILTGTTPAGDDSVSTVTITASDRDGASSSVSFHVVSDDGNDDITAVDLLDSNGNVTVEADVDENDASGAVLGEIRVSDQDHASHPYGTHLVQVLRGTTHDDSPDASVDSRFEVRVDDEGGLWLALKDGEALDFEGEDGVVDVTIRAVDLNGATYAEGPQRGQFMGNVEYQTVAVVIIDQNDAPEAQTIGNWWVTTERGQRADDIDQGEWLTFSLTADDTSITTDKPAFTDPDGDTLTYSLQGPAFLEINERNGEITNTKGGVPAEGVHRLTVTATDPDGESATTTFNLAIAFSDSGALGTPGSTDPYTEDNEAPRFGNPNNFDYPENSGERVVATFTVSDLDNNLGHHPFALDSVRITAVANGDSSGPTTSNATWADHDADANTPNTLEVSDGVAGLGGAFRLSEPRKSGNTWTYDLLVKDTNSATRGPGHDTTEILDYEDFRSIDVTITASDGTAAAVTRVISVRIGNVNDKPVAGNIGDNPATTAIENNVNIASGTYGVNQSEPLKEILYIKLQDLFTDQEDQPNQLTYDVSVSGSWIKILHGPVDWSDIEDDVTWNDADLDDDGTDDRTAVIIGDTTDGTAAPAGNEQVVIIELDRTERNNDQDAMASFTLSATDRGLTASSSDRATTSKTYMVPVTDQNLNPTNAVTLTGSAREDATLRASFNDDRDPDLAGAATPALVIYQWFRVNDSGTPDDPSDDVEATNPFRVSTSNSYTLAQADAPTDSNSDGTPESNYIRVKVKYYEVDPGTSTPNDATDDNQLVGLDLATVDNEATTSRTVSNTPDKGTGSITILADGGATHDGQLSVTDVNVRITDGDYPARGAVADTALSISWEWSENGRGGWEPVEDFGPADGDNPNLTLDDGEGKWYRAVVTYDADGIDEDSDLTDGDDDVMESVYSDPIQVSDISDDALTPLPTITGNAVVGGTLSVEARNTSVQWQERIGDASTGNWVDLPGATGSLSLTQAHAGKVIRALVTYHSTDDDNPGVTAVVAVEAGGGAAIPGSRPPAAPVGVDDHDIEVSVDAPGHGMGNNAGHNLSHTEMVPLASLFQDPDSARLTYTVTSTAGNLGTDSNAAAGGTYVYDAAAGGVLVFEANSGKLTFNSDVYHGHDGANADADDGGGNILTLTVTATDEGGRTGTANVNVRINVAPTDIHFAAGTDAVTPATLADAADGVTPVGTATTFVVAVNEHVGRAAADDPAGDLIAHVDVQDENADMHEFGTHEVTVSGDDRFMITHTGYTGLPTSRDDRLGSTWEVRLKPGEKLDYETQEDMDPITTGKQIVLTLTATDGGGLSTPSGAGTSPITLTITIEDVTTGDLNHPPAEVPNDVPGLEDNENTDPPTDDERTDDTTDGDTDGGSHPPPPGMSLGGIIEDFIDNMDQGEQDLLEDYLLTIDDGLDIL